MTAIAIGDMPPLPARGAPPGPFLMPVRMSIKLMTASDWLPNFQRQRGPIADVAASEAWWTVRAGGSRRVTQAHAPQQQAGNGNAGCAEGEILDGSMAAGGPDLSHFQEGGIQRQKGALSVQANAALESEPH